MVPHKLGGPRAFGILLAVVSLAFAACGGKSSSTSSGGAVTVPTVAPTTVTSPNALSSPCTLSLGQAYEPDGGNGRGFHGVQVARFEDGNQSLCAAVPATPATVAFAGSVGALAFSPDFTDSVALVQNGTTGGYALVQDVFNASVAQLVPVGAPYDLGVTPTAAPTAVGASPVATGSTGTVPLIPDGTSVAILGSSTAGLAFALGPAANPPAIVALTSLANAPPQYGLSVPFSGTTYTLQNIPVFPRSIVRISADGAVMLARGPSDLLSFGLSTVASGYLADAKADNTSLGYGPGTYRRGSGAVAFSPVDSTRALVGGTTTGGANTVTLVTGLPTAVTAASRVTLPGSIVRSIVIADNGIYAVAATDAGLSVLGGVNGSALTVVNAATALKTPAYKDCAGHTAAMTNVFSVGLSAGTAGGVSGSSTFYLVALGQQSAAPVGAACVYPAAVVAFPFNTATGAIATPVPLSSPTAGATAPPATFTQNNVIAPPTAADFMVVR